MRPTFRPARALRAVLILAALGALGALAGWGLLIGQKARELNALAVQLEAVAATGDPARWPELCTLAGKTYAAAHGLYTIAGPLPSLAPLLGGLPGYGSDIRAAGPLFAVAESLGEAAAATCTELHQISAPIGPEQPAAEVMTARLAAARPGLTTARAALDQAGADLAQIPRAGVSPDLSLRLSRLEALLGPARDGLDLALAAPALLGADGPRSYLIVVQNPDELRPTGGFISAAGLLRLENGRVLAFNARDSAEIDNLAGVAYPLAPEPIRRYMLPEPMAQALWLFRDANWSPDFPTSARQMLDLYRLGQGEGADGVLAITPEAARLALAALGPVRIEGDSRPVDAANVADMFRIAYGDALEQGRPADRKSFVNRLAAALLSRLSRSRPTDLPPLVRAAAQALDTRAALVFLPPTDPTAALLAARGWDGAVRPGEQDFLMVVGANVGYNKVGPQIMQRISYAVDLSDPAAPRATVTVAQTNNSPGEPGCQPLERTTTPAGSGYDAVSAGCYWLYLRVLAPGAARLADADVPQVPDHWMLGGDGDSGRVYSERGPGGTRSYGALLVIPAGGAGAATFRYDLPLSVVAAQGNQRCYRLRLQRQPGAAQTATVQILLPGDANLVAAMPAPESRAGQIYSFSLPLATDRSLEVCFSSHTF